MASRDKRANATNKAGKAYTTDEYIAFLGRVNRSMAARSDDMSPEDLAQLHKLVGELRQIETTVAQSLNDAGFSWAQIGAPQGLAASNAYRNYRTSSGTADRRSSAAPGDAGECVA
jgi:hypothetical protein